MGIRESINTLKESLPSHVKLIAVSKTKTVNEIFEAYQTGQRFFGENKAQELSVKYPELPKDIQWHFIGHLQTNKVKYISPFVSLIHSIDSLKLLQEVNKEAQKNNRIIDCLLQFYIAREETKFGLSYSEASEILLSPDFNELKNVTISGVMGMASFIEDMNAVRLEFKELRSIFTKLKQEFFSKDNNFKEISMGMSDDYKIAIEEGSTMVRIGTVIFSGR
jgi:PLP dependent protein